MSPGDADQISRIILDNLYNVNIRDYGKLTVDCLATFYSPDLISKYALNEITLVANENNFILGTASLDGERIRNVFVRIDQHKKGIGSELVSAIEKIAGQKSIRRLYLYSNISVVMFYTKLGYQKIEDISEEIAGEPIPMVRMEKILE